ncbi:MAG TPA: class II aldolase/adducin family protein [Candidatus Limnocylindrales bacterium]
MRQYAAERAEIVAFAQRMASDGLVAGTSGNISRRLGDTIAITPRNRAYDSMTPEDVALVDLDGQPQGRTRPASTEMPMHLAVYRAFGAAAVVHTHSPFATVIGTVATELPAVHYVIVTLGGPVRVAPYHVFGSAELAGAVAEAGRDRSAVILATHGAITWGDDLAQAYRRSVTLEWLAALYWRACQIGSPRILTEAELDEVNRQLERLDYASAAD